MEAVPTAPACAASRCESLSGVTDHGGSNSGGRDPRRPVGAGVPRSAGSTRRGRPTGPIYDPLGLYSDSGTSQTGPSVSPPQPVSSHQPLRARWDPTAPPADGPNRPRPDREAKKQSPLGRFVNTYGWRAYALPVLLVITIVVAVDALRHTGDSAAGLPGFGRLSEHTDKPSGIIGGAPKGDGKYAADLPSGAVPAGGPYTDTGKGTWHLVPGTTGQVGTGSEHVFNYTIAVEDGVDTASLGGDDAIGKMIDATLANPKSWTHDPRFAFHRVDTGNPDFRISFTSRDSTRKSCGFEIPVDSSCYNADLGRVLLSQVRWVRGALSDEGDVGSYRQYMINHEVGHAIGYHEHQPCETDGGLAPVMMQQTFGIKNNDIAKLDPEGVVPMDGKSCRFNPWPYPRG
ncbi:hypothetical protein NS506_02136 [Nocardia seriolae]|uniref:DUF3152 domain-containing protein n=1 Tax=Nocardia seriolae TaxID=37332 RepID=A0ABC8APS9_9NOCA|nr:hypothetical protein NS506_02136 [Nocardia seriolae]